MQPPKVKIFSQGPFNCESILRRQSGQAFVNFNVA